MHVFIQIRVQKMPHILQLRPRISAICSHRVFLLFGSAFPGGLIRLHVYALLLNKSYCSMQLTFYMCDKQKPQCAYYL